MKRLVSRILGVIVVLAVVGAIVMAFLPQPVVVETAAAERGPLRVTVDEDGQTRIKDKYIVSSPLAGQLQRIRLRAGDEVRAGETTIATIDPSDPSLLDARAVAEAEARVQRGEAAVRRAESALERANIEMSHAEDEMGRVVTAAEGGGATRQEVEAAITAWRSAREMYNAAQHERDIARFELEMARAALIRSRPQEHPDQEDSQLRVHAPIDGRVLEVFEESMTIVQPGTRLVELGDPHDLEVVIDVLSTDAVRIRPGAPVLFEYWGGEEVLHGNVRLVEPQAFTKISALGVEEQRVNVIIDFVDPVEMRETLGDGYRVEARIIVWEEDDVLLVPTIALFRVDGEWAVFVVEDGRAHLRRVEIGRQSGLQAQVISGLEEGEIIVTHPGDRVEDGRAVQISK